MKILSVSDKEISFLYSPAILERFAGTDLILSCGDLSYYYLEYLLSMLNVPLYFVRGNHNNLTEEGAGGSRTAPWGGVDLDQKVVNHNGLLIGGLEGSVRYNQGPGQYTQSEMWSRVISMLPIFIRNRALYGRAVDIFISHAPPWSIHDQEDLPHQGIKAFLWLIQVFQPAYFIHGHIHIYHPETITETRVGQTCVVNSFGYREIHFDPRETSQRRRALP